MLEMEGPTSTYNQGWCGFSVRGMPHFSVFVARRQNGHVKEYEAEKLVIRGNQAFRLAREIAAVSLAKMLYLDDRRLT